MGSEIQEIVRNLRRGKVATYGDISCRVFGHVKGAQAVGQAIRANAQEPEFPWWRVVDRKLHPTRTMEGAREKLKDENIEFLVDGSVKPRFHDPGQIAPR